MNSGTRRPLSLGSLRAFRAVARRLSFSAAADELFVTQSAVSRQIKALEDELGAPLFARGTRHVELTRSGHLLLQAVDPSLARIDAGVRQIRASGRRRRVSVTTFASFASLWLLPRIEAFQHTHPDIDIRVSASDAISDLEDPDIDLALRYAGPLPSTVGAVRLFGEVLTPAISRHLAGHIERGEGPPLAVPADLVHHTLAEEDDDRPGSEALSWRHWLRSRGLADLQPKRWLYLNFTYQQVQAALAGHGVVLARIALVADALARGELVEPFGTAGRMANPYLYWLVVAPGARARPGVAEFCDWILDQAVETRQALGEIAPPVATLLAHRAASADDAVLVNDQR